jgi:hypothetical protein
MTRHLFVRVEFNYTGAQLCETDTRQSAVYLLRLTPTVSDFDCRGCVHPVTRNDPCAPLIGISHPQKFSPAEVISAGFGLQVCILLNAFHTGHHDTIVDCS